MNAKRIKNCTPHAIDIWDEGGERVVRTIPRSGTVARLRETNEPIGTAAGNVPISRTTYGEPYDLPDPEPDTLLIVSILVKNAVPERGDLVVPVKLVRDEEGQIVGCRALGV